MRNPWPTCRNPACVHHTKSPVDFYRKSRKFCATRVKPIEGQHRPDLNQRIFEMAVSGASG